MVATPTILLDDVVELKPYACEDLLEQDDVLACDAAFEAWMDVFLLLLPQNADFHYFYTLRHTFYRIRGPGYSLHVLCFYVNFRRPWWKDAIVLRVFLDCMKRAACKIKDIMFTGRAVETASVIFWGHWLQASLSSGTVENGPVRFLLCVAIQRAFLLDHHMPTMFGCRVLSACACLAVGAQWPWALFAFAQPSFGRPEYFCCQDCGKEDEVLNSTGVCEECSFVRRSRANSSNRWTSPVV